MDKGFKKGWDKQDDKGDGKGSFSKGKGLYGRGATCAVLEKQDWSQWNGYTEGVGEVALALLNFTDSTAGKNPTTLSRSSEPMRVDSRHFIKAKKVVYSKLNTKEEKAKMQEQNRFEILGRLLEDNEVNCEEPRDVSVLRSSSPGTTSSATSRIPIVSRLVKTKKWSTEFLCPNFNPEQTGL